ncbi:MAG: HAMP domain-containing sensor histidine kinase [Myxococcota bacterium]
MTSFEPPKFDASAAAILDGLQRPVWIFDIQRSRMHWANRAAIAFWSAESLEDLLSRDWASDMSAATRQRLEQNLELFARGKTATERWTFYPRGASAGASTVISQESPISIGEDGQERVAMLLEASPFDEGQLDPDTIRLTEATLHTSLRMSLFDLDGALILQNPASALSYDAAAASSFFDRFVNREDAERAWDEVHETGEAQLEAEMKTVAGIRWHGLRLHRSRDPITAKDCFLLNETDLSDLKHAQAQLVKAAKDNTERRMAGGFAHEVRNALSGANMVIAGHLGLLENGRDATLSRVVELLRSIYEEIEGAEDKPSILEGMAEIASLTESVEEDLRLVRRSLDRTLTLTTETMRASKLTETDESPAIELELCAMIEGLIAEQSHQFEGVNLRFESDEEQILVMGREHHFRGVFQNLLFNARDALVESESPDPQIRVRARLVEGVAQVTVEDNGPGIDEPGLSQIFEPFFSTKGVKGTGLGLGIARRYMQLYGGSLTATSDPANRSTQFLIHWPQRTAEPDERVEAR